LEALTAVLQAQQPAGGEPSNILATLLDVQQALGYVPPNGIQAIAHALQVTEADVAGVLSYYPVLRRDPPPRHVIRICMGESCVANHCERLLQALHECVRIRIGETSPGHRFRLEQVFCLGNCAVGPTIMIDEDVYGRATPSGLDSLLGRYR
jgi:NADH:ubiquinone oxidoreductase subunit E